MMRKRDVLIQHWLNVEEAKRLRNNSKLCGLSVSGYVRKLINGYAPVQLPPIEYFNLIKELRAIGHNMHQISYRANSMNLLDAPYYKKNAEKVLELCDYLFSLHLPIKVGDINGYNKNVGNPQSP
jgi:hypothetical protein